MSKNAVILTGLIALIVGTIAGIVYQKNNDSLSGLSKNALSSKMQSLGLNTTGNPNQIRTQFKRKAGSGLVSGQIISITKQTLTIKEVNGSTQNIYLSASTLINKSVSQVASDLARGESVNISGSSNSDGSISAKNIQIKTNSPGA